jgi:hypothetical protein
MSIYAAVVQLYYKCDYSKEDIVKQFNDILLTYEHHTHLHVVKFSSAMEVVETILECEKRSLKIVKSLYRSIKSGKTSPVIDGITGDEYPSIVEAARVFKLESGYLGKMLRGKQRNTTNLVYKR